MKLQKEETKILLADSDFIWMEELKVAFEEEGFTQIKICADGKVAIREITDYAPHIAIIDQATTHKDGISIMQYIDDCELDIEVILTSRYMSHLLIHKASELGVQFILVKPMQEEVLVSRVKDIMQLKDFNANEETELKQQRNEGSEYELDEDPLLIVDEIGLESNIGRILMEFGIRPHLKGYKYLKTAIVMTIMNEHITSSMTKELYPLLARKYHTADTSIERDMRHAIETAWQNTHSKYKEVYFGKGFVQASGGKKPHNSLFINSIAEKIRHNLKGQIALMSI